MFNKLTILLGLSLLLLAGNVSAGLIGDTINGRWQYNTFDENEDHLVIDGIETTSWIGNVTLDVSDSAIELMFHSNVSAQSVDTIWTFSSLDLGTAIASVSASTNWGDWDDSFISFGADFIQIDFLNDINIDSSGNNYLILDINPSAVPDSTAVPAPASFALLIFGLAGIIRHQKTKCFS